MDPHALRQMQQRVLSAYEQQGFSQALIGGWAISENDVADLVSAARNVGAERILEVGTFVGVSTMLLALACPDAKIYTIDPNFELAREMRAVNADADVDDGAPRHHDIARRAAEILGVAERIEFIEGGFSVGDTYTSLLSDEEGKTPVVGPETCRKYGPFDFVFVDGLHTPDAVEADLNLAAGALTPGGAMVLHDCIGFWGASVRRGVMAFLRTNEDFSFLHPPFKDVYRSVGRVSRRVPDMPFRSPGSPDPELSRTLAALARSVFGKTEFLEISVEQPWLGGGDTASLSAKEAGAARGAAKLTKAIADYPGAGIAAVDAADFASDAVLRQIFRCASKAGSSVFLGATPPGEEGVAGPFSRPLARLADLARKEGLSLFLFPFADQEHARYPLLPEPRKLGLSSMLATLLVAAPGTAFIDALGRNYALLTDELALDREQEALQRVHLACAYRRYLNLAHDEQKKRFDSDNDARIQLAAAQEAAEAVQRDASLRAASLIAQIDAERQLRLREVGDLRTQIEASLQATRDLQRDTSEQEKSLLAQIDAERRLRLREVGELQMQLEAATGSAKHEQALRFEAVAELTRQLKEQSAETDRVRKLANEFEKLAARVEPLERDVTNLAGQRDSAAGAALRAENSVGELRRQLIEVLGGLSDLECWLRGQELRLFPGLAPRGTYRADFTDCETVSSAMLNLRQRIEAMTAEAVLRADEPVTAGLTSAPETIPDSRVAALEQQNAALNAEIARIQRSLSWRVLGPWRVVRRRFSNLTG